jgi:SAM-dependent methyltransferase
MVHLHPRLAEVALADCYQAQYEAEYGGTRKLKQAVEHFLVKRLPRRPPGRLLDYGCGTGSYLFAAEKAGWNVSGIDPWAGGFVGRDVHPAVHFGDLQSADFGRDSFDVVTMWWVVEHLQDPVAELAAIRRVMKRGGLIAVATSNIGSFEARLFGGNWHHLLLPEHCCHFSPVTLANTLGRAGFAVTGHRQVALTGGLFGSIADALRQRGLHPGLDNPFDAIAGAPIELLASLCGRSGLFVTYASAA